MRVCDRHNRTKATDRVHIQSTDTEFDLCAECTDQIRKFISTPKQETVEKKGFWQKSA
jgi:hypothetical protein